MSATVVPVVAVHGGAGAVDPDRLALHVEGVRRAAAAGLSVLESGGSSLDAVIRAVEVLEDDELFNAGTGGSLTDEGTLELDASVMEGTTLRGGGVCALPPFAHPIRVARAVLDEGRHVLYAGAGAAAFAERAGFSPADPATMITERARERLARFHAAEVGPGWAGGTVGAVACDRDGRVAAATSTGGTVGKAVGRVGDTPILGAGTYADDLGGAVSATGIGEAIVRSCLARAVTERLARGDDAEMAAVQALEVFRRRFGGDGGLVVVDRLGRAAARFNTATMSHAIARLGEEIFASS